MSWNEKGLETMREEFVRRVLSHEKSKSKLCQEYGISRPTGDKWIKRYLQSETMGDRSRAPLHVSNKTPKEIEEFIVEYRKKYPVIGAIVKIVNRCRPHLQLVVAKAVRACIVM